MATSKALRVVHIGSGRYRPEDQTHITYGIWRELARGFRSYHVIARAAERPADWSEGNLRITLIRSWARREAEFLLTQFLIVPRVIQEHPDVIVCQSPVLGGLAAILISRLTGCRILMELHGAEFFDAAPIGSRAWIIQQLSGFALRRASLIRVLSSRMRETLAQEYNAEVGRRAFVIPPRVDLAQFSGKARIESSEGSLRLAVVGTLNRNKGQLRLIRALAETPFPVELHIAGDGPDLADCRDRAAMLTTRSKLRVTCHGALSHDAVADVLRSCDLFVMYSQTEGTPRAIMEAMAVGLPVVTTNAGFCADIVQHGVEGVVLGSDPDSEIIGALEPFHADRQLVSRMGSAARARAERDYDAVRLFEVYRRLIAKTANS